MSNRMADEITVIKQGSFMRDAELIRVGSKIFYPNGDLHTDCKTINRAKRASREYQKSKGAMGEGRVRVALKPPQLPVVAA